MIKRIIKLFSVYLLSCVCVSAIFTVIYQIMEVPLPVDKLFMYSFLQSFNFTLDNSNNLFGVTNWLIELNKYIGQILFALMTAGLVKTIYVSRKGYIVLADKMIIRKRTSPGVENEITISVMAVNKNKQNLQHAKCEMTCFYYKSENPNDTNKATYAFKSSSSIINYYRFSFGLEELPLKFWETLMDKSGINYNELEIEICLSGKYDLQNDEIEIRKKYKMQDVIIAKESEDIISRKLIDGKITKSKPVWDNINKIVEYSENERSKIVKDIREYIKVKRIGKSEVKRNER